MKKSEAIKIFGGKGTLLAKAVGLTKGRISQWPEDLDDDQVDKVLVAAIRCGKLPPEALLRQVPPTHGQ